MPATAVSAPGKVLLAGGFIVLDRAHRCLTFGLDARIHVHIDEASSDGDSRSSANNIRVRSPQFKEAEWAYSYAGKDDYISVLQTSGSGADNKPNIFVHSTLLYVLTYLLHRTSGVNQNLNITILADEDYYSSSGTQKTGKFTDFGVNLFDAHKTGLGSSAALVTALTAAFVARFLPELTTDDLVNHQQTIHNLAQAAHCAAQGKVGSGFDVAAAVYGSCLYRRFSPSVLEWVGDADTPGFGERLHRCIEDLEPHQKWDVEILTKEVGIPSSLRLIMCDVDCGSQTPGMVKQVLAWRKAQPEEANLLWSSIQEGVNDLCAELKRLSELEHIAIEGYKQLREIILTIRSFVRDMSAKSGVPIEPNVQTELLDACSGIPGVLGGMCPGAGGFDAIALIVWNDDEVVEGLRNRLAGWKSIGESADGVSIGKVGVLNVKQDFAGVRIEDTTRYADWTT